VLFYFSDTRIRTFHSLLLLPFLPLNFSDGFGHSPHQGWLLF
jgi:hypothetical protein